MTVDMLEQPKTKIPGILPDVRSTASSPLITPPQPRGSMLLRSRREEENSNRMMTDLNAGVQMHHAKVRVHKQAVTLQIRSDLKDMYTETKNRPHKDSQYGRIKQKALTARTWKEEFGGRGRSTAQDDMLARRRHLTNKRMSARIQRLRLEEEQQRNEHRRKLHELRLHHRKIIELKKTQLAEDERKEKEAQQKEEARKRRREEKYREQAAREMEEWQRISSEREMKKAEMKRKEEQALKRDKENRLKRRLARESAMKKRNEGWANEAQQSQAKLIATRKKLDKFIHLKHEEELKCMQAANKERAERDRIAVKRQKEAHASKVNEEIKRFRERNMELKQKGKQQMKTWHEEKNKKAGARRLEQAQFRESNFKAQHQFKQRMKEETEQHTRNLLAKLAWEVEQTGTKMSVEDLAAAAGLEGLKMGD